MSRNYTQKPEERQSENSGLRFRPGWGIVAAKRGSHAGGFHGRVSVPLPGEGPMVERMARRMAETDGRDSVAETGGTEQAALVERLRQLALRDPLTGLLNRRGFDEELLRIWELSQRHSFPIGLLIIDIDHFKSVNDSYGHVVGDQVLKECVRLVQASVRETDIVCRYYGGDELVVCL